MAKFLSELFSLEGKIAVVIGGTGELCGAMAEGLSQAGAEVILVGRSEQKAIARIDAIASKGGRAHFVAADVSSRDGLDNLRDEVIAQHGRV